MFLHITQAEYIDGFKVQIQFNNGKSGIADLTESLHGAIFEPLKEQSLFAQLKVDPELETIVWPNGADLAPEYVYFQAFKLDPELQEQFKQWGYIA